MILHPEIISLLTGSILVSLMALYAASYGVSILRRWDLMSGSEIQLILEKKTYLISTLMAYAFFFLILNFFLFVFTAEKLHTFFVGAMCAAGTLNVNGYGYPALVLMVVNCLLAGLWLVMNYVDNQAFDYPLIRKKYALLLLITPFVLGGTVLELSYFTHLEANVITSCCGSLFSGENKGVGASLAALPPKAMMAVFFGTMLFNFGLGTHFCYLKGARIGALFSLLCLASFAVSVESVISFVSPYVYELPTHHCPFCILQGEYHYGGYFVYTSLLVGTIAGTGVGLLMPFRSVQSLREGLPLIQKALTRVALISYLLFTAFVVYQILFSNLVLLGV
jgi:hypothetical protein